MPVALLLQVTLGPLLRDEKRLIPFATLALDRQRRGLTRLEPFMRLVSLEETLIARARSAFLVHWFGTGLPVEGLSLRIHIANIDHLRRRYQAVRAATSPDDRGLNLTEPVLGLVGNMAGFVFSPGGIIAVSIVARRFIPGWLRVLMLAFGWAIIPALGLLLGLLLTPAGLSAGILVALSPQRYRALYDLMGSLARLIHQVTGFIHLLLGPRERIRNPILRQILGVADRFARLMPFVLALISLVISRVGPMVVPLARQGAAILGLTRSVMDIVISSLSELPGLVGGFLGTGRGNPIGRVIRALLRMGPAFNTFMDRIQALIEAMAQALPVLGRKILGAVESWFRSVRDVVLKSLRAHRMVAVFELLKDQLTDLGRLFPSTPSGSSAPSSGPSLPGWASTALNALFGPPPPPPPSFALPDLKAIQTMMGRPSLALDMEGIQRAAGLVSREFLEQFRLSAAAREEFDRAVSPPSQFARARRELERQLGAPALEVLKRIREEERPLREAITGVVASVLPPEIRVYLPELLSFFQTLEEQVYGGNTTDRPSAFPVRDVPQTRRLRVVVHRLVVRSLGGDEPHAGVFRDRLVDALRGQEYLAPAVP